mgnify:CR=1 FL=1
MLKLTGIALLVTMFLLSGVQKIVKLGNTQTKQFTDVFKLPHKVAQALVFMAGIIEVAAVVLIIMGEYQNQKAVTRSGIISLIAFTVLATAAFKVYPKFKTIQFLANMSVLGGLFLYLDCRS